MKRQFEEPSNPSKGTEYYINYIKLNKVIFLFKNWKKHEKRLINNPYDKSAYAIAKLIDQENPIPLIMPEVYFNNNYCSKDYEGWEELYLKKDLFISLDNLHDHNFKAFSLETVFLSNKFNGFLRTTLCYDNEQRTPMSTQDRNRFLNQLKKRYPTYYQDYLDAQPSKDASLLINISEDKLNTLLNAVELMLVLSCHKNGLRNTSISGSVTDLLSGLGYELLVQTLEEVLSENERDALKHVWTKNIHTNAEKTIDDLIKSALEGACTTTLGLYWLGLRKIFRPNIPLFIADICLERIYDYKILDSNWISKKLFIACIKENIQYIATTMLDPINEPNFACNNLFQA